MSPTVPPILDQNEVHATIIAGSDEILDRISHVRNDLDRAAEEITRAAPWR